MVFMVVSDVCVDLIRMWLAPVVLSVKESMVDLFRLKQNNPSNY